MVVPQDQENNQPKFKPWHHVTLGVFVGASVILMAYLIFKQPQGYAITLLPQPTMSPILIHVDGAVNQPGLYALPQNSRIQDAINLAGGLNAEADTSSINLASKLRDGEKIYVSRLGELNLNEVTNTRNTSTTGTIGMIDINIATKSELESLPGIGPTKADEIIQYRDENGPFLSIEDIKKVPGIGDVTFDNIQNLITVTP